MNKNYLLVLGLLASFSSVAKELSINQTVDYYDAKLIPPNIRNECTNLGSKFSESTVAAIQSSGWSVIKQDNLDTSAPGISLKLTIVNAHSGGNAFLGHSKSVSVEAELYKDGKLLDTYAGMRNSNGGIGGGFKGSCAVLERCVHTLGKDVGKWLSKQKI